MTMKHAKTMAFVWGSEPPAFSIGYEKPQGPGDQRVHGAVRRRARAG